MKRDSEPVRAKASTGLGAPPSMPRHDMSRAGASLKGDLSTSASKDALLSVDSSTPGAAHIKRAPSTSTAPTHHRDTPSASPSDGTEDTLSRLAAVVAEAGVESNAGDGGLLDAIERDLSRIESALAALAQEAESHQGAAAHLLVSGGKRIRPTCVLLAAALGGAAPRREAAEAKEQANRVHAFALAAELVHQATLLHDDVLDLGTTRRGKPCARLVYGNAASIYGGDWLLVRALTTVLDAGDNAVLRNLLGTIETMVDAEVHQLKTKGTFRTTLADYERIALGKTAALFRWALEAGAVAGGLDDAARQALGRVGDSLGLAFQMVDDILDVVGDAAVTGKKQAGDLREGKLAYPLVKALSEQVIKAQDIASIAETLASGDEQQGLGALAQLQARCCELGIIDRCRAEVRALTERALMDLKQVPASPARTLLAEIITVSAGREA